VAKRAERVRPADAIRYGAEQEAAVSSAGLRVRSMRSLSVPLILAIKSLALQRRRALFLVASVLFATVASSLAVNLDHSFGAMLDDLALFGFDSADVRVRRGGSRFSIKHERFMAAMNQRDDVAAIATWDYVDGIVVDDRGHTQALNGTLIDGDIDGLGFLNLRGRNPVGADEISLAIRTAQRNGKDVGDTFELFLLGQELRFVVTGVYQSINNTGEGFRVRLEAARRASPLYAPSQYGLVLREGVDRAGFIAGLEGEYGETVDAQTGDYFIRGMMDTIMGGMRLTNGFLAAIFLLAASVFIFNSTLMTIAENRRTFGILKTAGMTPAQLRASVVYGVALQAVAGIAAGLGTWWLGAGLFVSALFGAVGLVAFPLQNSVIGTLLLIPAVLGFCLLSAWIPSSRLLRLDPRGLIVE
jgi:putative ABC transport system permease protein